MAQSSFIANVAEFFTLEGASRTVESVGDAARRRIHDALALGRQKATCAETLWANGHTAEGLALAAGALDATLTAAPELAKKPADDETASSPDWREVLESRGVSKADLEAIKSAHDRSKEALPVLDRDVSPAHAELFLDLVRTRHRADRALAPGAMTQRDLRWTRVLRGIGAVIVAGVIVTGLYLGLRTPTGTFATASDFFQQSPQFAPENAIDGSPATYWLLPDGATGWLEVSTTPARHVGRVRVLNTTNPPWSDRGTNEYQLEVYSHGEVVRTIDGAFEWTENPTPVDHQVDLDDVDRVRFVVRSHHRNGAGLADLQLD
ncbi:MAG: hypothetical protein J0L92_01290 [Deltaproteobacteria bacterium]|nr:hypothetical protein [Deltaproteobacteria bacterium]